MKARILCIVLALLPLAVLPARAQMVVVDPSQIAASAANAADQIDYMLDQLGELASVQENLKSVHNFIDDVFGEDGVGGRTISVLNDLGTLDRLTRTYNATLEQTERYISMMKELGHYSLSDANTVLNYMNTLRDNIELGITTAKHILETLGFSRKEKKDELEKIIREMEESMELTRAMVEIEVESTIAAEGMSDFLDFVMKETNPDIYVEKMKMYGTLESAGKGTLGVVTMILFLLGIVMSAYGFYIYVQGGIMGDPTVENVFFRIGIGILTGLMILEVLASAGGIKL